MSDNNKLIRMTDFIIKCSNEDYEELNEKGLTTGKTVVYLRALLQIIEYAKFLKEPLRLDMFVPCNNEGEILEEPINYSIWETLHTSEGSTMGFGVHEEYLKAKQKVLFVYKPQFDISAIKHHISQGRNVEYLANFGELELSETAMKRIGLIIEGTIQN